MDNTSKIAIGFICLGLIACDGDSIFDSDDEQHVNVYQDDLALSCIDDSGVSLGIHGKLLTDEGIEIQCSQKGSDGFAYIDSCESETGSINIFTINEGDLSEAESLGFSNLSNLPDANFDDLCEPSIISMEDFEQQVVNTAGAQAIDCGKVEIDGPSLEVNTCVADSFVINTPFYAFYILQGIDSSIARGVSMDISGVVKFWSYDSYDEGSLSSSVCENPSATSELTGLHTDVITCSK